MFVFGPAIVASAFLLVWAAEAAHHDISGSLATAILAVIAVLPEYAVDLYFAAIPTVPIAATTASGMKVPGSQLAIAANHGGGGLRSTTLSSTIFSGHGAATLMAVSTPVAAKISTTQPRYGRSSAAASFAPAVSTSASRMTSARRSD